MTLDPAVHIPVFIRHLVDTSVIDKNRTSLGSVHFRELWFDWAGENSLVAPQYYLQQFLSIGMTRFELNRKTMYDFAAVEPLHSLIDQPDESIPVSLFQLFVAHLIEIRKLDRYTTALDYSEICRAWHKWTNNSEFSGRAKNFREYFLAFKLRRIQRKYKILFDFSTVEPLRTLLKDHDPRFKKCLGCNLSFPVDEIYIHLVQTHKMNQLNLLADAQKTHNACVRRTEKLEQTLSDEIRRRNHSDVILVDLSKQYSILLASYVL